MLLDKYGLTFNDKHTYRDFGLVLLSKTIGLPARTASVVRPPYSNMPIDYSNIYGHTTYDDRALTAEFLVRDADDYSKEALFRKFTRIVNWLESAQGRTALVDDVDKNYYYIAEPVKAPSWEEMLSLGTLSIEWTCNPFRTAVKAEGNTRWNDLNVNYDVAQYMHYDINGTKSLHLINKMNEPAEPEISVTGELVLTVDGQDQRLVEGTYSPLLLAYPIILETGVNYFTVSGQGTISFDWHKEMI